MGENSQPNPESDVISKNISVSVSKNLVLKKVSVSVSKNLVSKKVSVLVRNTLSTKSRLIGTGYQTKLKIWQNILYSLCFMS